MRWWVRAGVWDVMCGLWGVGVRVKFLFWFFGFSSSLGSKGFCVKRGRSAGVCCCEVFGL